MNYPSDWPCKLCNKRFDKHKPYHENGRVWCFWFQDKPTDEEAVWSFTPVDNLTLVEMLADARTTAL